MARDPLNWKDTICVVDYEAKRSISFAGYDLEDWYKNLGEGYDRPFTQYKKVEVISRDLNRW